jgi:hypothetical protein
LGEEYIKASKTGDEEERQAAWRKWQKALVAGEGGEAMSNLILPNLSRS